MSAPRQDHRLAALECFRHAVWGNRDIFTERVTRQSGPNHRIVEYLDFREHRDAVRYICNPMQESDKLLVVQEYRDAMNNFRTDPQMYYEMGACILGQPGIGKSCFIPYAVVQLLREKQPVAVQVPWSERNPHYVLLSEEGVHHYEHTSVEPLKSYPGIWAFSDADHIVQVPTVAFTHTPGVRTFQTTFPYNDRRREWTKQTGVVPYFMDLWSTEEIEDLAHVALLVAPQLSDPIALSFIFEYDINRFTKLEKKWGPVPRNLLRIYREPDLEMGHERQVKIACEWTAREPNTVIQALTNFSGPLSTRSSAIFFVKPEGKEIINRIGHLIWVPTRQLLRQLGEQLVLKADDTRVAFFDIMFGSFQTCSAARWIFEEHTHCYFLNKKSIVINWNGEEAETVDLPHLRVCANLSDVTPTPPSYWRPRELNFGGIDGVIVTAKCVLLIQVTIAQKHSSPQEGVYEIWKAAPALHRLEWKVLFIGSSDDRIKTVSEKYIGLLVVEPAEQAEQVEEEKRKRKKRKASKDHLPVGRVPIYPDSLQSWSFESFDDDEPQESDTDSGDVAG